MGLFCIFAETAFYFRLRNPEPHVCRAFSLYTFRYYLFHSGLFDAKGRTLSMAFVFCIHLLHKQHSELTDTVYSGSFHRVFNVFECGFVGKVLFLSFLFF